MPAMILTRSTVHLLLAPVVRVAQLILLPLLAGLAQRVTTMVVVAQTLFQHRFPTN